MIVLDTDVFSLAELPVSPGYARLRARVAQLDPPEEVVTTVITAEEQSRGRLAKVSAARNHHDLVDAYARLRQHFLNYQDIPLLKFDDASADIANSLKRSRVRIGAMDLRIAAICISRGAIPPDAESPGFSASAPTSR